jgi:hypothetical protein
VKTDGILKIKTAPNAQIILDSKVVGTGSFEGPVKAGGHTLRVVAGGMRPYQAEVLVGVDETRVIDVPLEPETKDTVVIRDTAPDGPSFELGAALGTGVKVRNDNPLVSTIRVEVALRIGRRVNFGVFGEYGSIQTNDRCGMSMPGPFPMSELDFGPRNQFLSCTYLMPGLQVLVHIRPGEKIDPYIGVAPAFRFGFVTWREYIAGTETGQFDDWLPGIIAGVRAGVNYHPKPKFRAWQVGGYLEASITVAGDEVGKNDSDDGDNGPQSYVTIFGGVRSTLQF